MRNRRLRLVYNPYAGRRKLLNQLDNVIRIFQENGYEVCIHRSISPQDIEDAASRSADVECLVVAGGDGSIHHAVNGLMKLEPSNRPALGILPVGTANDLAYALNLPKEISDACEVIARGQTFEMDLGLVNDRYFINVASAGLLSDISPKVNVRVKNTIGHLAYYLKGLESLPTFRPFRVEFVNNGQRQAEDILLMLAVNGISVGGMRQLMPQASLTDGKLDVLMIKQSGLPETLLLLVRLLRGEPVEDDKIIQFQTEELTIYPDREISSDLDGEWGPDSPWHIRTGGKISILR